ncbi:ATP-binding protein [Nocardioides aquaticus]|uniref:ATP-binding protein n=1 Tax=Nocardioides aquaticus TaxID=160826 RepID=UPI0031E0D318
MRDWWTAGLLLLVGVVGWCAVLAAPAGLHGGDLWPVGVASGVLLLAGRRAWAWLPPLAVVAFLGTWAGGRPVDAAAASALGIAAEVTVVWLVLTASGRERPRLHSFADLDRYATASVLGASTAALVALATTTATGFGDPALVALAVGATHLSSQLVVLPFFLAPRVEPPGAERREQVLAWLAVLLVSPMVFVVDDVPALGFLVMPLLVWGALRLGTWQALAQVLVVAGISCTLYTLGRGPVAWLPPGTAPEVVAVLLQLYVVGCALVVIPLVLMVSLRRTSDREAASERDKLASVVDAARGVAIIGTDEQGRITLFNPGAERLLGYRSEDVLGRTGHFLHSDEAIRVKAAEIGVAAEYATVLGALVDRAHDRTLLAYRRSDDEERVHLTTLAEIVDDRGSVTGWVSTSEDVTEQLEAQRATERALTRMKEVDALKDSFISTVSHELRTPVTSIVGYLEMLGDGQFGELSRNQRGAVARVEANSGRLLALVDDLLTLARMNDAPDPVGTGDPVPLLEVVRSGCAVVAPQADQAGVSLRLPAPHGPGPLVTGDRQALEGVVINLVGNAVKFTPSGGEVVVEIEHGDAERVRLCVRDTGIGIPSEELELLFTRFFRSSTVRDSSIPGSGLGLAIVQGVVQRHDGTIEVESEVGKGTTFVVTLPLAPAR